MQIDAVPSDSEVGCKPTLIYLRKLGVEKVNVPTSLNAYLLNTREKRGLFGELKTTYLY